MSKVKQIRVVSSVQKFSKPYVANQLFRIFSKKFQFRSRLPILRICWFSISKSVTQSIQIKQCWNQPLQLHSKDIWSTFILYLWYFPLFTDIFRLLDKLVDDVANDSNRFNQYQKMLTKNNQQRQNWITKRKAENETRRQNGQDELPLDEVPYKICLSVY